MQGYSNFYASKVIDFVFGDQALVPEVTLYCALAKGAVAETDDGSTFDEADYTSYARIPLTNNNTNFPNSVAGVKTIGVDVTFPQSTGGSNTIQEFIILDAATAGNIVGGGSLTVVQVVTSGIQPIFLAGEVELTQT